MSNRPELAPTGPPSGPTQCATVRFRLAFTLLILVTLPLASCVTSDHRERSEKVVITDYGAYVLRNNDDASVRVELANLLARLVDESNEDRNDDWERVPLDLLFVDDAIKATLREQAKDSGPKAPAAQYLLWFVGDKADIAEMQPFLGNLTKTPLLAPGLIRRDLVDAIRAVRETLKLPVDHFRTEGLAFNRQMTKAYVSVVVGPGAFNCEGWGLMFHLRDTGWELVWSRFKWIS